MGNWYIVISAQPKHQLQSKTVFTVLDLIVQMSKWISRVMPNADQRRGPK